MVSPNVSWYAEHFLLLSTTRWLQIFVVIFLHRLLWHDIILVCFSSVSYYRHVHIIFASVLPAVAVKVFSIVRHLAAFCLSDTELGNICFKSSIASVNKTTVSSLIASSFVIIQHWLYARLSVTCRSYLVTRQALTSLPRARLFVLL